MAQPQTLLLATDFTPTSDAAAQSARALIERWGCRVEVVYCIEQMAGYSNLRIHGSEAPPYLSLQVEEGRKLLNQFVNTHFGGLPASQCHLRVGRPVDEILRAATESKADLIMMGTCAQTGLDRVMRGSVAEGVISRSPVPVISLPHLLTLSAGNTLLVAIDFSPASLKALELAGKLAATFGCELLLLSVLEPPKALALWPLTPAEDQLQAEQRLRSRLTPLAQSVLPPGTEYRTQIRVARLAEGVSETADEHHAALVVMGTRGHSGIAEWLLGGGAQRVLRSCSRPLLTVRDSEAEQTE